MFKIGDRVMLTDVLKVRYEKYFKQKPELWEQIGIVENDYRPDSEFVVRFPSVGPLYLQDDEIKYAIEIIIPNIEKEMGIYEHTIYKDR